PGRRRSVRRRRTPPRPAPVGRGRAGGRAREALSRAAAAGRGPPAARGARPSRRRQRALRYCCSAFTVEQLERKSHTPLPPRPMAARSLRVVSEPILPSWTAPTFPCSALMSDLDSEPSWLTPTQPWSARVVAGPNLPSTTSAPLLGAEGAGVFA